MKVVVAGDVSVRDQNNGLHLRTGSIDSQRLLEDDAPDGLNFWFVRNTFAETSEQAFKTPRHRHPFAQIKFVEKGSSNVYPGKDIGQGELAYFPRAAYYGPQEKESCISIGMQFGFHGQHQRGPRWEERRSEAMERLRARGRFESGLFFETNAETGETSQRDSIEALYDERMRLVLGSSLSIEPQAYEAPILMHPSAFPYYEAGPGAELKHLGRFYDHPGPAGDVGISMARLNGGDYALSADRAQLAWTVEPGLKIEGRTHPGLTCLYSPLGEEERLSGEGGVEVYVVEFPRLH